MKTADDVKRFILAGRAVFTVDNGSGRHLTFRVNAKDPEPGSRYTTPSYFVGVLEGSESYAYIGILNERTGAIKLTKGSKLNVKSQAYVAASWALRRVWQGKLLPEPAKLLHAGQCGRCGRELTDPDSIERGIGPDCWEQMTGGR